MGDYIAMVSDNSGADVAYTATFNREEDVYYLRLAPFASRLLNISTRADVLTGDDVVIAGFIIGGTGPKKIILRGLGPSVGVNPVLADPTLQLLHGNVTLATNDNWKVASDGASQQATIEATGFAPPNDLESAIVATLNPGAYTVIMRGKNNGTGIGLIEVYDLAPTATARLTNISSRGFVGTGNNVMIGGFIVGGGNGRGVNTVVRALGPTLASAGVPGTLADPTLELHNADGTLVSTNDNWKIDDRTHLSQQAKVQRFALAPPNDVESVVVATLLPGNYTAIVRGKNNTSGVALVEVYNLL